MNYKQKFIDEIILMIKQEDTKKEITNIFKPLIQIVIQELYPFIYISFTLIIIMFCLILAIFILLIKNNHNLF